jgi:hypothetical protein
MIWNFGGEDTGPLNQYHDISIPTRATLMKYGGTVIEWMAMVDNQHGACGVCGKVPSPNKRTGRVVLAIDHEHVKGWKTMPPEKRWIYVRGLVCWFCNHYYLGRGLTLAKAYGVVKYLERYQGRKAA